MNRAQLTIVILLVIVLGATAALANRSASSAPLSLLGIPDDSQTASLSEESLTAVTVAIDPSSAQGDLPTRAVVVMTATPDSLLPGGVLFAQQLQTVLPDTSTSKLGGTPQGWNPPPMSVPIAHQPFDHFWLIRPVGSNNNNFALPHYAFGSDGPANDLRIHHGIDLANPIGVEVYASGSGTVIWSGKGSVDVEEHENITAYGNTIVIRHDIGYEGEPIFTLYAHLSARLVEQGERVETGQIIGLIGNTGQVTGPHVHFEVRIGHNRYSAVQNPELWMAPYIGTGVIAGRVELDDLTPIFDAAITVIDRSTGKVIYQTTSYAGEGIQNDPNWNENFVVPDVPQGLYLVSASHDQGRWTGEVNVVAGATNWVTMTRVATTRSGNDGNTTPTPLNAP